MDILRSQMQTLALNRIRARLVPCPSVSYVNDLYYVVLCWLYCTTPNYGNTIPYHTLMTCPPALAKLLENAKGAAAHQPTFLHL